MLGFGLLIFSISFRFLRLDWLSFEFAKKLDLRLRLLYVLQRFFDVLEAVFYFAELSPQ